MCTKEEWDDLQKEYQASEPYPEEVFVCEYVNEAYEGYSLVLFRNGTEYFWNEGSHCSCYGLEGQWSPDKYESKELFLESLKRTRHYTFNDLIQKIIKQLEQK